jgi:disulfide bond formation protein DsbB
MLSNISSRTIFLVVFLFCCGLMATGYVMEHVYGLEPCPLCMTQRVFIVLAGFVALIGCLHNPALRGTQIYSGLIALMAASGGGFSIRQLYLQSLPEDKVPACGPSVDYILETFPLNKALQMMLKGDGNCAEVLWSFMGISIPGWTLVAFLMIIGSALYLALRTRHDSGR